MHVFGIVVDAGPPDEVVASIPGWALQGGRAYRKKKPRGRPAKERKALQANLVALLEAALRDGLVGFAESDLPALGDLLDGGLPDGHALVLCEASVADEHPLVERITAAGARVELGKVEAGRGGAWDGLAPLVEELARESGVGIESGALQELARRTLRQTGGWKDRGVDAESTARLAGEYRKLASQVGEGGRITRRHVQESVEDRGEEDVWQILDALGAGRGDEALGRFERLIAGADDVIAVRLSFFGLLAGFCRQLTAVAGIARLNRVQPGERNYNRFKNSLAPKLQGDLPHGAPNPIAKIHPFRLHRAYMAASLMPRDELARLPWRVLETEMRIKGDASDADTAVAWLLAHLARMARGGR